MKIILSRKGFDSSPKSGRVASPIFPDNRMLSLPIPGTGMGTAYDDLQFRGLSVGRIVEDLTRSRTTGRSRIRGSKLAHHDPDLRANALCDRPPQWRALFGQADRAQSHLVGQGVGPGDLFLFFGRFRHVNQQDGTWRYERGSPHRHVIWGWLQVGEVWDGGVTNRLNAPPWAQYFDHFQFTHPDYQEKQYNAVYVARKSLELPGLKQRLPGAGTFNTFDEDLCLTKPGQPLRSLWKLPLCCSPRRGVSLMTYHPQDRWERYADHCTVRAAGRGQEFVIDTDRCDDVVSWARDKIASNYVA